MPRFIGNILKGFWAQYPVGTRLTWSFVTHQFNQNRITVFNFAKLMLALMVYFVRVWQVVALPFFTTMNQDVLRKSIPQDSSAAKIVYVVVAYPIMYIVAALGLVAVAVLSLLAFTMLPTFGVAVVCIWILVVSVLFVLWFIFYRFPVFEVIYPRLRTRILINNSHVYSAMPIDTPSIRLVRLKAGNKSDPIECELLTGPLADMTFEALSYVWGVKLTPYKIQVNGKPFQVTYNLHTALHELRLPDRERLLWIDAISINQYDNAEKGSQVQMMRDIYAKASSTVVWLGKGTKATSRTFEFVRHINDANSEDRDNFWKERDNFPRWRSVRRELGAILEYEWWERAWIIQEVVVSNVVFMQRGSQKIEWETLHSLLAYPAFSNEFPHLETAAQFAEDVQELRTEERANEPISNTLLGLAYRFRYQSATFGSDKVYALMGLLQVDNPSLLKPDYSKPPEDVFMQFTLSSLEHNKNLTAIALAAGAELQDVSWCRDWRFNNDGSFEVFWFSTHPPPGRPYTASGTQRPVFEADLEGCILSLQGYHADTIVRVGDFNQQIGDSVDWDLALRSWERVAGGPFVDSLEKKKAFDRVITGNFWAKEPLDWKQRILRRGKTPQNEEDKEYKKAVDDACLNRRFFITNNGKFGLGPWNLKAGDLVCVLFGGKTPFVLRQCRSRSKNKRRLAEKKNEAKLYHKVIGEVFVDGLMYYEGSMEDDIESGKVVPKWFHLL